MLSISLCKHSFCQTHRLTLSLLDLSLTPSWLCLLPTVWAQLVSKGNSAQIIRRADYPLLSSRQMNELIKYSRQWYWIAKLPSSVLKIWTQVFIVLFAHEIILWFQENQNKAKSSYPPAVNELRCIFKMNSKSQVVFFLKNYLIYETATESFLKENFKDRVEEQSINGSGIRTPV